MLRTGCIASIALAGALVSLPASAETVLPTAPGDRVHYNLTIDLPVTIAAGALALGSQLLSPVLARADCYWCDRDDEGNDTLNCVDKGARSALRWPRPLTADTISHVLGFGVSPGAPSLALERHASEAELGAFRHPGDSRELLDDMDLVVVFLQRARRGGITSSLVTNPIEPVSRHSVLVSDS